MIEGQLLCNESELAVQHYIDLLLVESTHSGVDSDNAVNPVLPQRQRDRVSDNLASGSVDALNNRFNRQTQSGDQAAEKVSAGRAIAARSALTNNASSAAFVKHLELAQRGLLRREPGSDGLVRRTKSANPFPEWASSPITCVTFKVANLKLAIPVQFVAGLKPLASQLTQRESDADQEGVAFRQWILGFGPPLHSAVAGECDGNDALTAVNSAPETVDDSCIALEDSFTAVDGSSTKVADSLTKVDDSFAKVDDSIPIVDTAKVIMPERYDSNMIDAYRHVIMIRDVDWCIAVDSIGGEVTINERSIRWRSLHTRRPWLAGTVIDDMCAIVDIDGFNRLLFAEDVLDTDNE